MGKLRGVLSLGLGLLGIACQDDGGGSRDAFADYWADGDAWCEHQAACVMQAKKDCELAWPTREATEDALELADLSSDQLSKCKASSMAYDDCFLDLSCAEVLATEGPFCPMENQRFLLDCAGLLDAFEMVSDEGEADPNVAP